MVRAYWLVAVMALVLSGCAAKAQVRVEPDVPALDPPPPPPRVVAVYPESPEASAVVPVPEKPSVPARPPTRPARSDPPAQPEPVRSEPTPPPPLTLKASPGAEAQTETAIRNLLGRVARDLARVNVATLDNDGRSQHDTAQRFLRQADEALKVRNVVLAGKLADKAATLALVFAR